MRRTLFYILITLLAFGGGIAAYKYHLQKVKEQRKLDYITSLNKNIREIESENTGFEELENAKDGDLITVQAAFDEKFVCHDVTEEQQNICTMLLSDNSSVKKSLLIRLKVCDESDNSNCIVWKPDGLCEADKYCRLMMRFYDDDSKPIDLVKEITFDGGTREIGTKPVQLRVTGKVSIEENKPKLLTPIEKIEIIETKEIEPVGTETKFVCENEMMKPIWEKLKKDESFIKDAYSVIEAREIKNCLELFEEPQTINLNGDQSDEIVLKGNYTLFCGSGGDCRTWIVSKIDNRYEIVFEGTAAESLESIKVLSEKNRKFQNLEIELNNHWEADTFGIFRFNGKRYELNRCFKNVNSDYTYNENNPRKLVAAKLQECL